MTGDNSTRVAYFLVYRSTSLSRITWTRPATVLPSYLAIIRNLEANSLDTR